jgi:lipoprotein NlpD
LVLAAACAGSDPPPRSAGPFIELKGVWHRVESEQSIEGLARRYRVPVQDIEEINGIDRLEKLEVGRQLFIPGARKPELDPTKGAGAGEGAPPPAATSRPAGSDLIWPVPGGKLSSRFGFRGGRKHEGIDISAAEGTAVLAAADGVVIYSGSGVRGYGNMVLIRHAGGIVTVYAHNRRNLVRERAHVKQGQVIAEVGHTGRSSGDHLHFEIRKGDEPQDPLDHVSP